MCGCYASRSVGFDFECLEKGDYTTKPKDGAYVNGMFLDGCKWSYDTMQLTESDPKVRPPSISNITTKRIKTTNSLERTNESINVTREAGSCVDPLWTPC